MTGRVAPASLHVVGRWLSDRARSSPGELAVDCRGRRFTYASLHETAWSLAALLERYGAGPGDRVATVTRNSADHVALFFACAYGGMVLVPLNWRLTAAELALQLDIAGPSLVAGAGPEGQKAADAVRAGHGAPALVSLPELVDQALSAPAHGPRVARTPADSDPLLIVFTSGSTGQPKGAVLSQRNCFWTNLSLDWAVPLRSQDTVLQVLPQCHVGGWNVQPLQAWWKGATVLIEPEFDPERVLALIAHRRVTTMMGVPTTYQRLAELPAFASTDLSSLERVIAGGAAMPPELARAWQARGVGVSQGYGLTEAAPNVLHLPAAQAADHPGSVGHPYGFVDVELHEETSGERADGPATGEIWVRGPNVFAGYWQDATATAAVMAGDWLRTGDVAERDADGYHRICGRIKEIYISGGENVYPAEIEAVLCTHPAIADAAVVGAPDARWGESGVAFVQFRPGARAGADEVLAYCRRSLAGFKIPRRVVIVEALPRLATGKLDKRQLAVKAASRSEVVP